MCRLQSQPASNSLVLYIASICTSPLAPPSSLGPFASLRGKLERSRMRALLSTFLSSLPCSLPLQLSLSPSSHRPYVEKSHFTVVSRTVRPSVRAAVGCPSTIGRVSERVSGVRASQPPSSLPPSLTQPLCLLSSRADQLASPPLLSFPLTHESPSSSSYPSRRAAFLWKCARHSPSFPG